MTWTRILGVVACALSVAASGTAFGQLPLQVTEIMSDTVSFNEDAWEWIEVKNTGATPIDLHGYIIERLGDAALTTISPSISANLSSNTVIPAGGVAVLYDGDVSVAAADYNDALFRQAWSLAPGVPLIAVSFGFGGGLTNTSGAALGFWPDATAYMADLTDDGMGVMRVSQFSNAALNVDFRTASGFPAATNGVSLRWNGSGSFQDGANWGPTTAGTTSVLTTIAGDTNSSNDVGSPGLVGPGLAPEGLRITEIMYNTATAAVNNIEQWEFAEIFNNTGATIDFEATPYVFHDTTTTADLAAANIASGVLPNGGTAVLFNDAVSLSSFAAAWDPGGARETLFIPVDGFPALANTGDTIAIWDSIADYMTDSSGTPRVTTNAVTVQPYDDETASVASVTGVWPTDGSGGSISLANLSSDPTVGENWVTSSSGDALGSFNATAIPGTIAVHPSGDLGTPGVFSPGGPAGNANFDGVGGVDGTDFLIWQRGRGVGTTLAQGDADGDFDVDADDLAVWVAQYGSSAVAAVPEPSMAALAALAIAASAATRRRRE